MGLQEIKKGAPWLVALLCLLLALALHLQGPKIEIRTVEIEKIREIKIEQAVKQDKASVVITQKTVDRLADGSSRETETRVESQDESIESYVKSKESIKESHKEVVTKVSDIRNLLGVTASAPIQGSPRYGVQYLGRIGDSPIWIGIQANMSPDLSRPRPEVSLVGSIGW